MSQARDYPLAGTLLLLSFSILAVVPESHAQEAVCNGGFGSFESISLSGVTVSVDATRNGPFAAHSCEAKLAWDKQRQVVEPKAWQVDVDAMGIDLGLGSPVVAFQVKRTDIDRIANYEIYSLKKPPVLLRTIKGGDRYRAADTDLDGRIEIWTSDAEAVSDFENISLEGLDFAPMIVLRFERKRLTDVSSEFQSDFDRQIATVRAQLDARKLGEFKLSDGALSSKSPMSIDQLHRMMTTKIKILEIVRCYLYSDREQEAWSTLTEMWPPADLERIRTAIVKARDHGIRSQVDDVSHETKPTQFKKKHAMIYDRVSDSDSDQGDPLSWDNAPGMSGPGKAKHLFDADTFPIQILLQRPPPQDPSWVVSGDEVMMDLVVDSAGKVRSAKVEGKPDKAMEDATADWKFIPAFKDGHPIASRLRLAVSPLR
jgi:hypothetical protein